MYSLLFISFGSTVLYNVQFATAFAMLVIQRIFLIIHFVCIFFIGCLSGALLLCESDT